MVWVYSAWKWPGQREALREKAGQSDVSRTTVDTEEEKDREEEEGA